MTSVANVANVASNSKWPERMPTSVGMGELTSATRDALATVDRLLGLLCSFDGATDLHLKAGSRPRVRLAGVIEVLKDADVLSKAELDVICAAFEERCGGAASGRGDAMFTYSLPGVGRFRVTRYRQRDSLALVFHRLHSLVRSMGELRLPGVIADLLTSDSGLLVVASPPRSGRTATLAAIIDHLNSTRPLHIVAIEPVVEILHRDQLGSVCQRELDRDAPSMADAVREGVHQDADVLVVDEVNDVASFEAILSAVEAGLLVIAGVDAPDVATALGHLLNSVRPEERESAGLRLSAVLIGATCQRLLPATAGGRRVPAVELLVNDRFAQLAVMTGEPAQIRACLDRPQGRGQSLERALATLLAQGDIELRSALAASGNWPRLQDLLREEGWLDDAADVAAGGGAAPVAVPFGVVQAASDR